MTRKYTIEERTAAFWSGVNKSDNPDGCWLWTRHINSSGYGVFQWEKETQAHRVAWMLTHGPIPDGLWVLHNCPDGDNPACVNPAHLWLGTCAQNNADRAAKGRNAVFYGETNKFHKFSDAQIAEIKRRYSEGGVTQKELAREYGANYTYLNAIIVGRRRKKG